MDNQDDPIRRPPVSKRAMAEVIGGLGLAAAVAVPVWQNYYVDTPQLTIEINAIERSLSKRAGVSLAKEEDLKLLLDYRYRVLFRPTAETESSENPTNSIDDLKHLLTLAQDDQRELPTAIENWRSQLQTLKNTTESSVTFEKLRNFNSALPFSERLQLQESEKSEYLKAKFKELEPKYQQRLDELQARLDNLKNNLPAAEKRINKIETDFWNQHAIFTVTAAFTNSGRSTTSVRKPALLRVYIGRGNYVDLKLEIDKYSDSAEISAHGTKIVTLTSEEVSTLPSADQSLVSRYWDQSVPAVLFVEDILGYVHSSNGIAFAEGVYEKMVYDRLATEASRSKYFDNTRP